MNQFDGPFPANVPAKDTFEAPRPNDLDEARRQSGNLPPSSDPVKDGPKPHKNLRG